MKVSSWYILLALYFAYFFGVASNEVGKTLPENIVSWYFPYELMIFFLIPAIFGYLAGKEEYETR